MRLNHIFPREQEGGKPLTQGDVQTLGAGMIGWIVTYFGWVPTILQFLILVATTTYVVFRAIREVYKFFDDRRINKHSVRTTTVVTRSEGESDG